MGREVMGREDKERVMMGQTRAQAHWQDHLDQIATIMCGWVTSASALQRRRVECKEQDRNSNHCNSLKGALRRLRARLHRFQLVVFGCVIVCKNGGGEGKWGMMKAPMGDEGVNPRHQALRLEGSDCRERGPKVAQIRFDL